MPELYLRPLEEADLASFFAQQQDPVAIHMAAFTAKDPSDYAAFHAHWQKIMADSSIIKRAIIWDNQLIGQIAQFEQFGEPEVTYWLDRHFWGQGLASQALHLLLNEIKLRPLFARVAQDNHGSLKVLTKAGFQIIGEDSGFANGRGCDVAEYVLRLD
ncbi:GNAT family N-acetyltransferase [Herpetosiphon geysericola]|uniref:Acetyltransferase n=1 Tax=Herpetosiphon geysericola TaxID=70996 RepID=A0A0P6Y6U3_9CHLR|nr:GNAT family N-acetyltransferase [Herpetosiphon geysericola]KPL81153.1 acetyltransferase [Herpetosiphon geysericola]